MGNTNSVRRLNREHLRRTVIGGLMGTMLGVSCGLALIASVTEEAPSAPAAAVEQVQP